MMTNWRTIFNVPTAFFGIVQLSTWCPKGNSSGVFMGQQRAFNRV